MPGLLQSVGLGNLSPGDIRAIEQERYNAFARQRDEHIFRVNGVWPGLQDEPLHKNRSVRKELQADIDLWLMDVNLQ